MQTKGIYLVFLTALISGVSIFINKFAVSFSDPVVFAFLKNSLVAVVILASIFGWKKWEKIKNLKKNDWKNLLIIGIIGGGIPFILFFKGLALTTAASGSFIHKSMFIYVALLAAVFLGEKINRYFLIGGALLFFGNLLAIKTLSLDFGAGEGLVFLATLFWATENIFSKKILEKIDSDILAWGRMFFGSVFIFLYIIFLGGGTGGTGKIFELGWSQIGWVMITAGFLFGYVLTWYRGLSKIPVTLATSILLLGSPVTTLLTFLSGDKINVRGFFSTVLITAGIGLAILSYEKIQRKLERA